MGYFDSYASGIANLLERGGAGLGQGIAGGADRGLDAVMRGLELKDAKQFQKQRDAEAFAHKLTFLDTQARNAEQAQERGFGHDFSLLDKKNKDMKETILGLFNATRPKTRPISEIQADINAREVTRVGPSEIGYPVRPKEVLYPTRPPEPPKPVDVSAQFLPEWLR